jgi:hypothetical protein
MIVRYVTKSLFECKDEFSSVVYITLFMYYLFSKNKKMIQYHIIIHSQKNFIHEHLVLYIPNFFFFSSKISLIDCMILTEYIKTIF